MNQTVLEVSKSDGIGWLTLNRPDNANAVNSEMGDALFEALSQCNADPDIACLVLKANGKLFCGGGDIFEFGDNLADFPASIRSLAGNFHRSVTLIDEMEKPLVTSVHGSAAGAGLVLAALGDIALASDRASFLPAYLSIGLTPDGSSTWTLPRLMGTRRAMEFLLTGRKIGAEEAAALNVVTRVVPHDDLSAETEKTARRLVEGAALAKGRTRKLIRSAATHTLAEHLEMEADFISRSAATECAQIAISAALKKPEN